MKNDLDGLIQHLTKAGLPLEEIEGLKQAIASDSGKLGKPSFEGETGTWFTRLLGRAANGAIGVGVDIVSTTVAKVLADYIGR